MIAHHFSEQKLNILTKSLPYIRKVSFIFFSRVVMSDVTWKRKRGREKRFLQNLWNLTSRNMYESQRLLKRTSFDVNIFTQFWHKIYRTYSVAGSTIACTRATVFICLWYGYRSYFLFCDDKNALMERWRRWNSKLILSVLEFFVHIAASSLSAHSIVTHTHTRCLLNIRLTLKLLPYPKICS